MTRLLAFLAGITETLTLILAIVILCYSWFIKPFSLIQYLSLIFFFSISLGITTYTHNAWVKSTREDKH